MSHHPPPQWVPTDWALRAFESMGFSVQRKQSAYVFKRDETMLPFPEYGSHGFDVFHLFRTAKVHGIAVELWVALMEEEDIPQ